MCRFSRTDRSISLLLYLDNRSWFEIFKFISQNPSTTIKEGKHVQKALKYSYGSGSVYDLERFRLTVGSMRLDLGMKQGLSVSPKTSILDSYDLLSFMWISNRNVSFITSKDSALVHTCNTGTSQEFSTQRSVPIDCVPDIDSPTIPASWKHVFDLVKDDVRLRESFRDQLLVLLFHNLLFYTRNFQF